MLTKRSEINFFRLCSSRREAELTQYFGLQVLDHTEPLPGISWQFKMVSKQQFTTCKMLIMDYAYHIFV